MHRTRIDRSTPSGALTGAESFAIIPIALLPVLPGRGFGRGSPGASSHAEKVMPASIGLGDGEIEHVRHGVAMRRGRNGHAGGAGAVARDARPREGGVQRAVLGRQALCLGEIAGRLLLWRADHPLPESLRPKDLLKVSPAAWARSTGSLASPARRLSPIVWPSSAPRAE